MKNYWKQFAAWATELKTDLFLWTRIKLTLSYILTLTILLVVFSIGTYFIRLQMIYNSTINVADQHLQESILKEAARNLIQSYVIMTILAILAAAIVGYRLSEIMLKPLRDVIQAQKRFIADASHELRTPLSVMKANSEVLLLSGDALNIKEAIAGIKSNLEEIDRMTNIIQNLLHLDPSSFSQNDIPFSSIDLSVVVQDTINRTGALADEKHILFRVLRLDPALVWGNKTALEEMILNLLKNAIAYTPEYGKVFVTVKNVSPHSIELSIEDTGVGISQKNLAYIFEPFYKADKSRGRNNGSSSGLGLTIVKEIVQQHNASIHVSSTLGRGTVVNVSFPSL
jgi:two-component system sensor histidine kinase CiaH